MWSKEEVDKLCEEDRMQIRIKCMSGPRCVEMMRVNWLVAEHNGLKIEHR